MLKPISKDQLTGESGLVEEYKKWYEENEMKKWLIFTLSNDEVEKVINEGSRKHIKNILNDPKYYDWNFTRGINKKTEFDIIRNYLNEVLQDLIKKEDYDKLTQEEKIKELIGKLICLNKSEMEGLIKRNRERNLKKSKEWKVICL